MTNTNERPRSLRKGSRNINIDAPRRPSAGSGRNNLRNNHNNRQKAAATTLPQQHLPVPGIQQQIRSEPEELNYDVSDDRKSVTGALQDYYENYDYNYYTEFEVLRKQDQRADKSIQHKIQQQFTGSTSQSRPRDRAQPQLVSPSSESRSEGVTLTSVDVTGGCLNDCVNDCVAIKQLTAYRDCVGFCGKTCKD